jgi:hypothetical protein
MFDQFLPKQIDNSYRGQKAAIWIFVPLLLLKVVMSVNSIFIGHMVATSADGIPLDTFPPAAARAMISFLAMWGLGHFVLCALCILVLVRYRRMIPFMFGVLLLEHLIRRLISHFLPIERIGAPPAVYFNLILLTLMVAGLLLSLWTGSRQNRSSFSDARGAAQ